MDWSCPEWGLNQAWLTADPSVALLWASAHWLSALIVSLVDLESTKTGPWGASYSTGRVCEDISKKDWRLSYSRYHLPGTAWGGGVLREMQCCVLPCLFVLLVSASTHCCCCHPPLMTGFRCSTLLTWTMSLSGLPVRLWLPRQWPPSFEDWEAAGFLAYHVQRHLDLLSPYHVS